MRNTNSMAFPIHMYIHAHIYIYICECKDIYLRTYIFVKLTKSQNTTHFYDNFKRILRKLTLNYVRSFMYVCTYVRMCVKGKFGKKQSYYVLKH